MLLGGIRQSLNVDDTKITMVHSETDISRSATSQLATLIFPISFVIPVITISHKSLSSEIFLYRAKKNTIIYFDAEALAQMVCCLFLRHFPEITTDLIQNHARILSEASQAPVCSRFY